jgi:hypothetical protein
MKRSLKVVFLLLLTVTGSAAEEDFVGQWDLTIVQGRTAKEGLLDIRQGDSGLIAYVEGGPVSLIVDGNNIEMGVDDRKTRGGRMVRYLRGHLDNGSITGEFGPDHEPTAEETSICERMPLACTVPTGTWSAVRHVPEVTDPTAGPVDLSGAWVITGRPLYRYTSDLTEAGEAWKAEFDVTMDLPGLRCQPWGLVNSFAFRGFDPEIFQTESQVTIVQGSEARRIYLDGRQPPEYSDWYPLGFSSGHWEGDTLVVETSHLQPSIREWMGDPVGENARVTERYSIDDEGRLVGVMTLHDPDNYNEPPIKRARWRKADPDAVRFPTLCDPDSFYRDLYDDGLFEAYWARGHRRY